MAMTLDTAIKFTAKLEGTGLDQLKRNLQGLSQQSNVSKRSLDQLYTATKALSSASNNTVAGLQRTVGALKALRDNAEFGSRKFKLLTNDIEAAEARLRRFQGAASASGGLSKGGALLAGFAGGVAGSLTTMVTSGAMDAARGVVQSGLAAETAQVRLRALTDQFGEYNAAQAAAARIAQTLRISQTEAQDSFSKLYAALRPTGVTLKEVEDAYIGFTAAARASGATATESAAALEQLKQALGSGVLQGDELRSIREQAPAVGQAIAKELGVTVGELKNLGSEGKITTDVVLRALARLKGEKLDQLNEQFNTGTQALKDLQIAAESVGKSISRIFGPAAVAVVRDFAAGLRDVASVLGSLSGDKGAEAVLRDRIRARDQAAAEAGSRFGLFDLGGKEAFFRQRQEQLFQQYQRERAAAGPTDQPNVAQQAAQTAAAKEREAARERAAMETAKKSLADQLKIREDMEKRLADFREQSIRRAADLERDLSDQRKELERSIAEARTRIARQQEDRQLEEQRRRLRAQGLGTESVDAAARVQEILRQLDDETLQAQQNATDRKVQLERTLGDYQLSVARGISDILQDAGDKLARKMAAGGQAAAAAMTGAPMPAGGIIARTGSTGQSTGPHLDARWANGRRITAADADRYLSVNGRDPSSYGVTSGYGPRRMFGRSFHAGMDFGTPSGSGISLKGGASLLRDLGFTGAGGYAVEIMTPEGPMRLLHLQGGSAARGGGGAAAVATPGVDAAGARLSKLLGVNQALQIQGAQGKAGAAFSADLTQITSQLDDQLKSSTEQVRNYERMVQLQRSGVTPELAKQRADLEAMAQSELTNLQSRGRDLELARQKTTEGSTQRQLLDEAVRLNDEAILRNSGIVDQIMRQNQALEQQQQIQERNKQLAAGIAGAIGQGIGSAIDLLIDGTENWGNSLRQIAAGVLKDIARQIAQTLVIAPIVKGITSFVGGLFPSANGNVFTPAGVMPYAMGGVVTRPTLFPFADGGAMRTGLMGEAGPEAILPLTRGRGGKLGVVANSGDGGTVVNVSVDASGSTVQGDAGRGEQLGRVVAQAVQQELVRQKRPGGLLAA